MKICFVTQVIKLGGAERVLLETIEILKEAGIECHVLVPSEGDFTKELQVLGVSYSFLKTPTWIAWQRSTYWDKLKSFVRIVLGILPAIIAIRRCRCDIVYTNSLPICNSAIAAKILGKIHVWHLHEFPNLHMRLHFGLNFSLRIVNSLSTSCLVVSKYLASRYEPYIEPSKLNLLYPSVHSESKMLSSTLPVNDRSRFRCVIIGGLFELKRQDEALAALLELRQSNIDAELVIVGSGSPQFRNTLENIVRVSELTPYVIFTGELPHSAQVIEISDVVLVCCPYETFGRVTIEAMLAGKPIVGTRAAATAELIQDGVNGLLYEPGNPKDLAKKIKFLHDDPLQSQRMGENGRKWAHDFFTRERYANQLMVHLSAYASGHTGKTIVTPNE